MLGLSPLGRVLSKSDVTEPGKVLITVKILVKHGEWLPWLEENFEGSQPAASRYMTLAENYSRVNSLSGDTRFRKYCNVSLRPRSLQACRYDQCIQIAKWMRP
ncbi:DUF3102 domain-containing protein [Gordonia jinhuaensis]|uniref:DUF3102 domain-containing protein n=1 Tax=Gordonia jinhuaensis TaxID=1517702 RepID=UPI0035709B42